MTRVPRRVRIWVGACFLMAAGCLGAVGGCSVNGYGLLGERPTFRENDQKTGRSVMIDSWGINLSTIGGDAGVTLGRVRRTYYFPGPASGHDAPAADAGTDSHPRRAAGVIAQLGGDEDALRLKSAAPFDWPAAAPLAVRGRTDGLSVETNARATGVSAGIHAFEILRLPANANLLILIKSRSSRPADDVFHVKEIER